MAKQDKVLERILSGVCDANISFTELRRLLADLSFQERIKGGHHIFTRNGVIEIINIQPLGSKAKAYQVKQVRDLILKYRLGGDSDV